jgi:hypothetical protein
MQYIIISRYFRYLRNREVGFYGGNLNNCQIKIIKMIFFSLKKKMQKKIRTTPDMTQLRKKL